jgi:aminomethyltransferase
MKDTFCLSWDQAHGARLVDFHGWRMPISYAKGILYEHQATRTQAGLFNISHMGRLFITGNEATKFSNFALTNDIEALPINNAEYGLLLNQTGGIIDDVIVYKYSPHKILWIVNAGNLEKDLQHLQQLAQNYEITIQNISEETALLALQGPWSQKVLAPIFEGQDLSQIPYFGFTEGCLLGRHVLVMATGYTGEDGYELMMDQKDAMPIWEQLAQISGVEPCGLGARDSLRLEAGLPLHGNEMDETTQPFEVSLNWAVKMNKPGGFYGKESLKLNPNRQLIGVNLVNSVIPRSGQMIFNQDKVVGHVTSGNFSPTLKKGIALGSVQKDNLNQSLTIEIRGKHQPIFISKLPWVRNIKKKKAKRP